MGARTSAARAEVVAAREALGEEAVRLEASARAAVDIPARIRREPLKMAGAASGAAAVRVPANAMAWSGSSRHTFW